MKFNENAWFSDPKTNPSRKMLFFFLFQIIKPLYLPFFPLQFFCFIHFSHVFRVLLYINSYVFLKFC